MLTEAELRAARTALENALEKNPEILKSPQETSNIMVQALKGKTIFDIDNESANQLSVIVRELREARTAPSPTSTSPIPEVKTASTPNIPSTPPGVETKGTPAVSPSAAVGTPLPAGDLADPEIKASAPVDEAEELEAQQQKQAEEIKRLKRFLQQYITEFKKIPRGNLTADQLAFRAEIIATFTRAIKVLDKGPIPEGQQYQYIRIFLQGVRDHKSNDKSLNDWFKKQIKTLSKSRVEEENREVFVEPFLAAGDRVAQEFLVDTSVWHKEKEKMKSESTYLVSHSLKGSVEKDMDKMLALYKVQLKGMIKKSQDPYHKALLQNILDAMPKAQKALDIAEFSEVSLKENESFADKLNDYVFSKVMSQGYGLPNEEFAEGISFEETLKEGTKKQWDFDSVSPKHQKLLKKLTAYIEEVDKEIANTRAKAAGASASEHPEYQDIIAHLETRKTEANGQYAALVGFAATNMASDVSIEIRYGDKSYPANTLQFLSRAYKLLQKDYANETDTLTEVLEAIFKQHPYYNEIKALDDYIATLKAEHPELEAAAGEEPLPKTFKSTIASVFKSQEGIDHAEKLRVAQAARDMLLKPSEMRDLEVPEAARSRSEVRHFNEEAVQTLNNGNQAASGGRSGRLEGILNKMAEKAPPDIKPELYTANPPKRPE